MNKFEKSYEKKLEAQKAAILSSPILEQLEQKAEGNKRLEKVMNEMSEITGKPVYEDFNFRTGKLFGIMRHLLQNPKQRQQLLEVTGLSSAHVDLYYQVCGNLPYVSTTNNQLVLGREMDCDMTKELLKVVATTLGVVIDDGDIADINQERWQKMYAKALADAEATVEFNQMNTAVNYEE